MTLGTNGMRREAIGFGLGDRKVPSGPMDVAYHIQKNEFRGRTSIELVIHDFRASEGLRNLKPET